MLSRWLNGLPQLNMNSNPSAHMREVRFAYAGMADGVIGGLHSSRLPIIAGGQIRQLFTMGVMRPDAEVAGINLPSDLPGIAWARIAGGGLRQLLILTVSGGLRQFEAGIFGKGADSDAADDYEGIGINARRGDMVEEIVNNRISYSHVGSRFRRKTVG